MLEVEGMSHDDVDVRQPRKLRCLPFLRQVPRAQASKAVGGATGEKRGEHPVMFDLPNNDFALFSPLVALPLPG